MKICSKCKKEKDKNNFFKNKSQSDGLSNQCKECNKQDYYNNQEKYKFKNKLMYKKFKNIRNKKQKLYNYIHKEEISKNKKQYYNENKDLIITKHNEYCIKRRQNDINFRLICNCRSRLNKVIKKQIKNHKTMDLVGCTADELRFKLEQHFFEGMNWENYGFGLGKWNIDHIIPLSSFDLTDVVQLKKACHYTNLQPLWQIDNIKKGSKLIY
jgi:hypothetical protein